MKPTVRQTVVAELLNGPRSIAQLIAACLVVEVLEDKDANLPHEEVVFGHAIEKVLEELGCTAILNTSEKRLAFGMKRTLGCFDAWPAGELAGYEVYDSIAWLPRLGIEKLARVQAEGAS